MARALGLEGQRLPVVYINRLCVGDAINLRDLVDIGALEDVYGRGGLTRLLEAVSLVPRSPGIDHRERVSLVRQTLPLLSKAVALLIHERSALQFDLQAQQ